jgi:hypothetical protein
MMQSREAQAAADARVVALSGKRMAQVVFVGASLTLIFTLALLLTAFMTTSDSGVRALGTDYRVFWSAARLALQGDWLVPFDMAALAAVHDVNPEEWMPWLYPPGYLMLIAPFGIPAFAPSFLAFTLLGLALIAWAVRPFVGGSTVAWLAFVLAPAYLPTLLLGQNSLIWFAGFIAACAALRDGRYVLAGVFIGCLTLKPQLGVMLPIALAAAGLWRTILVAALVALLLAALPTLVTGLDYWPLFLERLGEQGDKLLASIHRLDLMVGALYLLVRMGVDPEQALILQGALVLVSAVSVFIVWRSDRVELDVKIATLLAAMFLSAPYLWYYEAVIMALCGLFLVRGGILDRRAPSILLLTVLWFGAGLQAMNVFVDLGGERFPWAVINTPAMLLCLGLCLMHLRAQHRLPVGRDPAPPAVS